MGSVRLPYFFNRVERYSTTVKGWNPNSGDGKNDQSNPNPTPLRSEIDTTAPHHHPRITKIIVTNPTPSNLDADTTYVQPKPTITL